MLFCPQKRARHLAGDLEEIFHEDIKIKGKSRAKLLYWAAVLRSIGPLLWVKVRRAGLVALLLEIGRRWSGPVLIFRSVSKPGAALMRRSAPSAMELHATPLGPAPSAFAAETTPLANRRNGAINTTTPTRDDPDGYR